MLQGIQMKKTILGLATVAVLAACGTEPDVIEEAMIEDAALVAADATIEDINLWGATLGFSGAPSSPAAAPGEPGGRRGFSGSFSGTREVTFYDEAGMEMDYYDALETESILIDHEIEGEAMRDGWSATIYRARMKTVSGLAGEETERTWNGTGESEITRSRHLDDGTERSYEMEGSVEYEDVVVPVPGSDPRYPLSGTIRRSFEVTRTGPDGETTTRSIEVVITFDGSETAIMTVNGEEREIDLTAADGRTPLRRRG